MPVRYDPILTSRLAEEIARRLAGREARALVLDGDSGTAALRFAGEEALRVDSPRGSGAVRVGPAARLPGRAVPLRGLRLVACRAPVDERVLLLSFAPASAAGSTGDDESGAERGAASGDPSPRTVAIELREPGRNVLLLDAAGRIEAALRPRLAGGRAARAGERYEPPASTRRWREAPPGAEAWVGWLAPIPPAARRAAAMREAAWLSGLNAGFVLGEASERAGEAPLLAAHARYLALRDPSSRAWLLERPGGPQPYPASLGEEGARPADSLLAAMEEAARAAATRAEEPGGAAPHEGGADEERAALRRTLEARLERTRRRRAALERQLGGADAESLRALGHLLLARQGEIPRGASRARLEGFDGAPVEVELDPARDAVENAERLYDEARRRERAARRLPARLREQEEEESRLLDGLRRLEDAPTDEALWELAGGRPAAGARVGSGAGAGSAPPLPYHRFRSSGGLEIRVGRGARSNDALTFRHSAPEDIWLHARQVPGAHVVLRWGRRDENPPQRDLVEAAVAAAVHSEARHSGTVAVDWTRRKHVRKPRGAAPGAVVPERVRTLFVEPDPGRLERLRRE